MKNNIKFIVKLTWNKTNEYLYYAHYKNTVRTYRTNDNLPKTVLDVLLNGECVKTQYFATKSVKREIFQNV